MVVDQVTNSITRIGIWEAPLHYRALQRLFIAALHRKGHFTRSKRFQIPLTKEASSELKWWSSEKLKQLNGMALNPPAIDAIISTDASKKGWGQFSGRKDGGSVAGGRRGTHQCIGTQGSLPRYSGICQGHHEPTSYSGAYGQLHGGIIHKQARGDTFTDSGISGDRDIELLHLSENMDYNETCFWSDKHRSRFRIEELQRSNGMDSQQDGIPENNQEVLYARSGLLCLSA